MDDINGSKWNNKQVVEVFFQMRRLFFTTALTHLKTTENWMNPVNKRIHLIFSFHHGW